MNQLERRLFEMLQVLAGERGDKNKRAVRLDEIQGLVSQFDNQSIVKALDAVKAQAEAQGVEINEILTEIVIINQQADNIIEYVDDEVQGARNDLSDALQAESQARSGADQALETDISNLTAEVGANTAAITQESAARVNADSALAGQIISFAAEFSSPDAPVLRDQFLAESNSNYWSRVDSQGTLTRPANTLYSIGNDWRFVVASGQVDGFVTRSDRINWRGAQNADKYMIEVDFTLESGTIAGAGVWFDWVNTSGTVRRVEIPFTSASIGPVVAGQPMTATFLCEPASPLPGTFSFNRIYVFANRNNAALGNAAKTIRFHRVSVRTATDAEKRLVEAEANITQESIARVNADAALATSINTVQTNLNGTNATVSQQASAISTLEGNAAATLAFRTKAGTAGAQLELVAASDPTGNTSIARIDATNIILNGTVTAGMMNVAELSAITATLGTFQSAATGARVVIEDDRISVYDENNALRVRLGRL
jgi:hypothetical protein